MTLKVRGKILVAVIVPIVGMIAFALFGAISERQTMLDGRKDHVRQMVEAATTIFDHYRALAEAGKLTAEEAQTRAFADVRDIRFAKNDYIFVYSSGGILKVLGPKPSTEGQDRTGQQDPDGKYYVREFVETARRGGGFVAYQYPREGTTKPVPKVAAIAPYKPWDLLLGCGVYLDDIDQAFRASILRQGLVLAAVTLAVLAFSLLLVRSILRPLAAITQSMVRLAEGARDIGDDHAGRNDEIGDLAKLLGVFRANALALDRQQEDKRRAEAEAQAALHDERVAIASRFEERVIKLIDQSFASTNDMHATAQTMSQVANDAMLQAQSAAAAAEQATTNVQTVAAASEELYSSITEISRQVGEAAQISSEASRDTERVNGMMQELSAAAQRIGEVVNLVTDIASQTNLLALNATIEAARAGEAGKGFAVVAGEVKNLANQTGRATEEIAVQVHAVQAGTDRAVEAIRGVGAVIEQVKQISSGIAAAVEQQGAATQEIARNVSQAATGTQEVSSNIAGLTAAAGTTGSVAEKVLSSSGDLRGNADRIRGEVQEFLTSMKSG